MVRDSLGTGGVLFAISELRNPAAIPTPDRCGAPTCVLRTGQHGEVVQVFTSVTGPGAADEGRIGLTVYVYSGRTVILAVTSNGDDRPRFGLGLGPTRSQPPLTADQLIAIATAPELVVFP